jgi:hypothetical protein
LQQHSDLKVEPGALAFGTDRSEVFFTLLNDGVFAAEWTLEEVVRESEDAAWQPADVAWFAADTAGGRLRRGGDRARHPDGEPVRL